MESAARVSVPLDASSILRYSVISGIGLVIFIMFCLDAAAVGRINKVYDEVRKVTKAIDPDRMRDAVYSTKFNDGAFANYRAFRIPMDKGTQVTEKLGSIKATLLR